MSGYFATFLWFSVHALRCWECLGPEEDPWCGDPFDDVEASRHAMVGCANSTFFCVKIMLGNLLHFPIISIMSSNLIALS